MEIQSNKMGRVRPVPEGEHNAEREYRMLSIVYSKDTNKSYISKKDVPAGINIDNKIYWQVFGNGKFVDNAIINVSYLEDSIIPHTLAEAISMVDEEDRRPGIVLVFFEKESNYDEGNAWILYQFKGSSIDDWDKQQYWVSVYNRENKFKGWFLNSTELVERWPNPFKGDYAYVGQSLNNSWIWRCNDDGTWSRTSERFSSNAIINYYGDISNNPDFEDIDVDEQNRLKFANREPNENEMGYVILRKDKTFAEQVTKENTIYEIRYNFILDENVTIPANCMLKFNGGSIEEGGTDKNIINGNRAIINYTVGYNIFHNCIIKDFNIPYIDVRWFGAKLYTPGDTAYDSSNAFSKALECLLYNYGIYIYVCGSYYISTTVETDADFCLKGDSYIPRIHTFAKPSTFGAITKSIIYVANGVTAFILHGRYVNGVSGIKSLMLDIENIAFRGYESGEFNFTPKLLEIDADGGPSYTGIIHCVEATAFDRIIDLKGTSATFAELNISECNFEFNNHIIYCNDATYGICNLSVRNTWMHSCLEALHLIVYANLIIDNCVFESNEARFNYVYIKAAQRTHISITNNYLEEHGTPDLNEYKFRIIGIDNSTLRFYNNSYNCKIYSENIIIENSNRIFEFDSKFKDCYFIGCSGIEKMKLSHIENACFFDEVSYPCINNTDNLLNVAIRKVRLQEGWSEEVIQNNENYVSIIGTGQWGITGLPAANNTVAVVQKILCDVESMTYAYKLSFADHEGNSLSSNVEFNFKGNAIIVLKCTEDFDPLGQNMYFAKGGAGNLLLSDIAVYYGVNEYDNIYKLPAYKRLNTFGTTRPTNPIVGMCYFDSSPEINKPIWYNGNQTTGWVDATGTPV